MREKERLGASLLIIHHNIKITMEIIEIPDSSQDSYDDYALLATTRKREKTRTSNRTVNLYLRLRRRMMMMMRRKMMKKKKERHKDPCKCLVSLLHQAKEDGGK